MTDLLEDKVKVKSKEARREGPADARRMDRIVERSYDVLYATMDSKITPWAIGLTSLGIAACALRSFYL